MEVCYTKLGNLRAADITIKEEKSYIKYLYTYESREKELPILLYLIDIKDGIKYYKEYYTGSIIMSLDTPAKIFRELDNNVIDKKVNAIPSLAVASETLKPIDDEFTKNFYLNDELDKIDNIIISIKHLASKTKTNIADYIHKMEQILSFKCFEKAYLDNAIYNLQKGYTYKTKTKKKTY